MAFKPFKAQIGELVTFLQTEFPEQVSNGVSYQTAIQDAMYILRAYKADIGEPRESSLEYVGLKPLRPAPGDGDGRSITAVP
jgi:hypothetical protein